MLLKLGFEVVTLLSVFSFLKLNAENHHGFMKNQVQNITTNSPVMYNKLFDANKTIKYGRGIKITSLELLKHNNQDIKIKKTMNRNNQSMMKRLHFNNNKNINVINTWNITKETRNNKTNHVEKPLQSDEDFSELTVIDLFKNNPATNRKETSYYLDTEEDNKETSSEMARGEEVEKEANKLKKTLFAQEALLYESFDKVPIGGGKSLIKDLIEYNQELNAFLHMAETDKPNTYGVVQDFLDPNNPIPHVAKMVYSEDRLKRNFRWSDDEYRYFEKNFKNTTKTFFELELSHHEFPYS